MSDKEGNGRREMLKTTGALAVGAVAASLIPAKKVEAAAMLPRWAMVIDLRRCIGCRACTVACKAEYNVPLGRWSAVVKNVESGTFPNTQKHFLPRLCNHCTGDDEKGVPPCVEKCPEAKSGERMKLGKIRYRTGATYKRPDGVILVDNTLCIGCGKCITACPYGVRYFDPAIKLTKPNREKDFGIGKCSFCQHRIDKGILPACVVTCAGRARIFGDLDDPDSEVYKLVKEFNLAKNSDETTLLPGEKTQPNVYYIDPNKVLKSYKIDKESKEKEFSDHFE